jgi:predicted ATPase/DNA-binding SARP family transcriptional activator
MTRRSSNPLQVYLLGSFRVERDAQTIRFPARKVESLFAFLVLHPQSHSREKLSALLWGDSTDDQARHSLRTALATIRKALGDDALIADRETVQLNPGFAVWVDAREISDFRFQISDSVSPQSEILNLKSEIDLLPNFYDEWILPERERLRAIYLDALLQIAQQHRAKSEYARAIEIVQKILTHDSAHEKAYQHLIFCLAATGDRIGALKQFDACEKKLRDELGVAPSPETIALRDQIETALTGTKAREALLTNVPVPLTSFVGREKEIREIWERMESARLVTLTGAGGAGKTRLAIQVATDFANANRFKNGVWWVDLAALSDGALVPQAIAFVFDLRETGDVSITNLLTNFMRAKELLLVLDNCEHLIAACAELAEKFLLACPTLKIIATSREAFNLAGEVVWRVPSLAIPDPEHLPTRAELTRYDAIQLFAQRARAVASNWQLDANVETVARVCARLDGMPLALELAAARVKGLSVEEIAQRLDQRFQFLASGSRTAPTRQQTLRATIDWSFDLLTETERVLLRRLGVFVGGWTLAAAEAICADESFDAADVLELLLRLIDKSLVLVETRDGATRYRMSETIREYAREKLNATNEGEKIRHRHLNYYLKLAHDAETKLHGPEQLIWFDTLELEHNNLRAALEWSLNGASAGAGMELAAALLEFWNMRAHWSDTRELVARLLAQPDPAGNNLARANVLLLAGMINRRLGDWQACRQYLEELITLARELGEAGKQPLALGLRYLSDILFDTDSVKAESMVEEGLAIARSLGVQWVIARLLLEQGVFRGAKKNYSDAQKSLEEALSIWQSIGDKRNSAFLMQAIASLFSRQHNYVAARQYADQSLLFAREIRDRESMVQNLMALGEIARAEGKYDLAKRTQSEGLEIARELGQVSAIMLFLNNLGDIAVCEGDLGLAKTLLIEGVTFARQLKYQPGILCSLLGFAGALAVEKQARRAAQLLAVYATHIESGDMRYVRDINPADEKQYQHNLSRAHAQLDDATFNAAWEDGRAMTLEQAVEFALAEIRTPQEKNPNDRNQ